MRASVVLALAGAVAVSAQTLRPPAVPIHVHSPYYSVWQGSDNLTDSFASFWAGQTLGYVGLITVDGEGRVALAAGMRFRPVAPTLTPSLFLTAPATLAGTPYRWMGQDTFSTPSPPVPPMQQLGLPTVTATQTAYSFVAGGIQLNVTFTTPVLGNDLPTWVDSPFSYTTLKVAAVDGAAHAVNVYFGHTAELSVNDVTTNVTWARDTPRVTSASVMRVGSAAQAVLGAKGDGTRISWGWHYLAVPTGARLPAGVTVQTSISYNVNSSRAFVAGQPLPSDDTRQPRACEDDWILLAAAWSLGSVAPGSAPVTVYAVSTYDEVASMSYYGTPLTPAWQHNGTVTAGALISRALTLYTPLMLSCAAFDAVFQSEMTAAGGPQYAALTALAYRQVFGSMTYVTPPSGAPACPGDGAPAGAPIATRPDGVRIDLSSVWAFMEEMSSDGDVSTVDVIYPASPALLYYSPELLWRVMVPVMGYAAGCSGSPAYPAYNLSWAPHDLGTWPIADRPADHQEQMPLEESGNMLILAGAIANMTGNVDFISAYQWQLLEQWAQFVNSSLPTPPAQLCTDDFEGPEPNNTNLVVKGITGMGSYARLLAAAGRGQEAAAYLASAAQHVAFWLDNAIAGTNATGNNSLHYVRQYGLPDTFSLKYNSLYHEFLQLGLFGGSVWDTEFDSYLHRGETYGVPLDDRNDFTLVEYMGALLGVASSRPNPAYAATLLSQLWGFANDTPQRVPMTDWYQSKSADCVAFRARATVGDLFAMALMQNGGQGMPARARAAAGGSV